MLVVSYFRPCLALDRQYVTEMTMLMSQARLSMPGLPTQAFNLIDGKELVPLQELIDQMVN